MNSVFADVMTCEVMKETFGTDGIYVISSCPRDYTETDDVKQACETATHNDVIHRLPVSGGDRSFVYRNIYCAACHAEARPWFWLVALRHCDAGSTDGECQQLTFHPPTDYVQTLPRTCLRDTGRCADDWQNETLAAQCQAAAGFVTDGRRVFRNRYCAQCNHVDDDAQLDCITVTSADVVTAFNRSRFDVVYDLNAARQVDVMMTQPSSALALQCDADQVFDPLLSDCVALPYCAASWSHCHEPVIRRTARDAAMTLHCPTGLVAVNSSDHIRYANGSVFVLSLQTLFDRDDCRYDNETIYVCVAHESLTFSLTLFSLHDGQRLVSVVSTVIGLLALVTLLSSYCLLTSRRRDNSSKMAVCFVMSILLYHVIYVAVLAGSRLQFVPVTHLRLASLIVCAGLQYFAMATFFWLHVLSIETFRAVRRWCTTQVPSLTSCTALLVYSLYAWCIPALIVGWSTALSLLRITGSSAVTESCCVLGLLQLLLFVVPLVVSLLINVVLYVLTALTLCRHSPRRYDTDTLLPDRHSPKVDTQWTTRSWSAERLRAERSAADAVSRRWNDIYVTCIQTSLLLAATWTLGLLLTTGWTDWPLVLWYVYIALDLLLVMTVCVSWCSVERVWYVLVTRRRDRRHDDDSDAAAAAAAGRGGSRAAGTAGRRTPPPAFSDAAASLRLLMRETSI